MGKGTLVQVIVHRPKTEAGIEKLGQQMAEVWAESVQSAVSKLECPTAQKLELLQGLIDCVQQNLQKEI